jgi:hypothetical protein
VSQSPSHAKSIPLQPTRRQLDELDALLQRMLELPVLQAESESVETVPQSAYQSPSGYLDQERQIEPSWESGQLFVNADEEKHSFLESMPLQAPAASIPWQAEEIVNAAQDAAGEQAQVSYFTELVTDKVEIVVPQRKSSDFPNEERISWAYASLLWLDDLFVNGTLKLGRLGFWLRGPSGRAFLGGLGLAALGIAVAFSILDRMNWPR